MRHEMVRSGFRQVSKRQCGIPCWLGFGIEISSILQSIDSMNIANLKFPSSNPCLNAILDAFSHRPYSYHLASNCTILSQESLAWNSILCGQAYLFVLSLYNTRWPHSLHLIGSPFTRPTLELHSPQR